MCRIDNRESATQTYLEIVRPFTHEDIARSWRLTLTTLALVMGCLYFTFSQWPLPVRMVASVLMGLMMMRVFVIYHDYEHDAILRHSRIAKILMSVVSIMFLRPPAEWRRSHDFHHRHNARLSTADVGSFPLKTTEQWASMTPSQRFGYKVVRSPLVIVFAYVTCFVLEAVKKLFAPGWSLRIQSALVLALHASLLVICARAGWDVFLLSMIVPYLMACCVGVYMFYVQHNFEGALFKSEEEWDFGFAAMKSSSCLDCGPVAHWFSANIGYHHIHHLNHRIPFYRLPEAMEALSKVYKPTFVKLTPREIQRALKLKLWDAKNQQMVGY